jgi:hypothetical protein
MTIRFPQRHREAESSRPFAAVCVPTKGTGGTTGLPALNSEYSKCRRLIRHTRRAQMTAAGFPHADGGTLASALRRDIDGTK